MAAVKVVWLLVISGWCLAAKAAEPGPAALEFLEKVRNRKVNLEPGGDTALSAQTGIEKRREIARRLERLAGDLDTDSLEIGPVKSDDDLAAVLVRKSGGFDPGRLQVFAVAMVKRGANWLAAPVPASFENSGTGYAAPLRARIDALETWMLSERVKELENLRQHSGDLMRKRIEASLKESDLKSATPEQAMTRFLTAFETKDLAAVLGLLGGLSDPLPDDWAARLKAADAAMTHPREDDIWHMLVAPQITRIVTSSNGDANHTTVFAAFLDPAFGSAATPALPVIPFDLTKSPNGVWRVNPPVDYSTESEDDDVHGDSIDTDASDAFGISWSAKHPVTTHATAEEANHAWFKAMTEETPKSALGLAKLTGPPGYATRAALQAARHWWLLHDPTAIRQAVPLAMQADASFAVALVQFFSPRALDELDARPIYFELQPSGWVWTPEPAAASRDKFAEWIATETTRWESKWRENLTAGCPVVADLSVLKAPTADEAKDCVNRWLDATQQGNIAAVLATSALLKTDRSVNMALQNIGLNSHGNRKEGRPEILNAYVGNHITAVGTKAIRGGKLTGPVYFVVTTTKGQRVLAELDVVAGRSSEFLNRTAFDHILATTSDAAKVEMKELLDKHAAAIATKP